MSNAIAQSRNPVIQNIKEYIYLKEVHSNTALIGGKIIYDGKVWPPELYAAVFPPLPMEYDTEHAASNQIEK